MNKYELEGTIKLVRQYPTNPGITVVGIQLEVEGNNRLDLLPIIAFNKMAEVVLRHYKVGDRVNIVGHLQTTNKINAKNIVQIVAHKIKLADDEGEKEVRECIVKDVVKEPETVKSEGIKQISTIDFEVVNVFANVKEAAKYAKVKKSVLEKAINDGSPIGEYVWSR